MIKLKDLLTESFFVAITPKPRDKQFRNGGSPRLYSKGMGAGLLSVSADKILASEVGRNISAEAKDKLEIIKTYDEKGVHHGRTGYAKAKAARKYVSAIVGEVNLDIKVSNKTIPVTKNIDMIIGKSQKEVESILKSKYKVRVESINEAKYKGYDYKRQNRKDGLSLIVPALRKTFTNMKDLKKYIDKHGTMESVNEAPAQNIKDQYVGEARVRVEPNTYKKQIRNYHSVSMYRDHRKPYNYYLSIILAHNKTNKIDMIISTGTHILSKAGKWAQGFMKRRMSGTGKERFD